MKELKKIKNRFISRQIGIAKLAIKTGSAMYKNKDKDLKEQLKSSIEKHVQDIVSELGVMKGSFMKAGQMLSVMGSSFLPPKAQAILKSLESQSSFLSWDQIKTQVPTEWLEEMEIEKQPIAAASLGQVHKMTLKDNDIQYVLKIQYKGVAKAIKNDIRALKLFLKALNLVPKEIDLTQIYQEIEMMLKKEVDYEEEFKSTMRFREKLKEFKAFKVPKLLSKYSNDKVICSEFIEGYSLHQIDEIELSQKDRNYLGKELIRLVFLELFIFENIQTDSHFGNYILITKPDVKWGLIDFGATKTPPKDFIVPYRNLILSLRDKNRQNFIESLKDMGYLSKNKGSDLDLFWEYAMVIGTPFYEENFDWSQKDISNKIYEYIPKLFKNISIGSPPSHSIFIDRKIAGIYFILHKLKANFDINKVLDEVLEMQKK
ncbi:MAG: AarF/ABC1/UbiB kinase family protein [Bacteriovoracaceae bacterium]|jgi:predicted unusual protein kinase regulating ubiquinone biosynthesis (AarF/ABC1/UbiB family)|nr:AarF/ABC1/UbiB kinase family protein [Bacteriovoracaceae bacterium]